MIYWDIYHYLTRKSSAKEIDLVLELVNRVDWESKVRVNIADLARTIGTTSRYVREMLRKLSNDLKGKKILQKTGKNTYIFLKGKSALLYSVGDQYGQKYSYLYSNEFQQLNLYGKRLILKASMSFSLNKQRRAYLSFNDLVGKNDLGKSLIPDKDELNKVLEDVNTAFGGKITAGTASLVSTREQVVYIEADSEMVKEVEENYIERLYLRDALIRYGFAGRLEEDYSIEMEKVGKHIFTYLVEHGRLEKYRGDRFKDLVELARDLYNEAIKRMAAHLQVLIDKGETAKAVSAYFSSVLFSVVVEKVTLYKNKVSNFTTVLKRFLGKVYHKEYQARVHNDLILIEILEDWVYRWVKVRVKTDQGNWQKNKEGKERNQRIKNYVRELMYDINQKLKLFLERSSQDSRDWLNVLEDSLGDYIDITNNRMEDGWMI